MTTPSIEQPKEEVTTTLGPAEYLAPELSAPQFLAHKAVPLLKPGEYLKRFEAHDASLHKSLLVLLALLAFWLAIESSYGRFNDLLAEDSKLRAEKSELKPYLRERREDGRRIPATSSGSKQAVADPIREVDNLPEQATTAEARREQAEERKEAIKEKKEAIRERKKEIEDLKREAVQLSIIGTQLPSRLHYAPSIWLAVLIGWMLFFLGARRAAHRNLAACHAGLSAAERMLGAAGEGKFWLAPIPSRIWLQAWGSGTGWIANRGARRVMHIDRLG